MQGGLVALVAPLAILVLAACYETPMPACAFACSQDGDCPGGYSCREDRWCKRDDISDAFLCAPPVPDAGFTSSDASEPADAPSPDAGGVDADPAEAAPLDAVFSEGWTGVLSASPFTSMTGF